MDFKNLHRVIKKIRNKIIYVKRNISESSSNQIPYRNLFRRPVENKPLGSLPPPTNLNIKLDDVAIDNFFKYHQVNHPEKACPQWINPVNLVASKFLDECMKIDEEVESLGTIEEENHGEPEETSLDLWDMLLAMNMFEGEKEEKDVQAQSDYNLRI